MEILTFGKALRVLRQEVGLSQTAAGEMTGVARQQISRYEADAEHPQLSTLLEYVNGLHRKLADLEQIADLLEADTPVVEILELRHQLRTQGLVEEHRTLIGALLRLREVEREYDLEDANEM